MNWLLDNWIELAGNVFALCYLFFSIRENRWLWVLGFMMSFFYMILFFKSRLYADMSLQVYYLFVSVYGWFHWMSTAKKEDISEAKVIPTISINAKQWLKYGLVTCLLTLVIFVLLKKVPDLLEMPPSDLPFADAFKTAGSIVATWMLARKILENWLIWIVIDLFSLGIYLYKGLYLTSVVFVIYSVMAVVGYYRWKHNMQPQVSKLGTE